MKNWSVDDLRVLMFLASYVVLVASAAMLWGGWAGGFVAGAFVFLSLLRQ